MKALIVDDCDVSREILGLSLSSFAETDYAEDGESAVNIVNKAISSSNPYDLICLDISMPGMGGQEVLRRIREIETIHNACRAKVFIITASSSPEDMIELITEGGCDDYLTKPVIGRDLLALVKKHFDIA